MNAMEEQFFNFIRRSPTAEIYQDENTWSAPTKHYMQQFTTKSHKKFFLSWNWATFFFKDSWFIFRKMYLFGLLSNILLPPLTISVFFIVYLVNEFLVLLPFLKQCTLSISILTIAILYFILPALIGDSLYISWVKKQINKHQKPRKSTTWPLGIIWYFTGGVVGLLALIMEVFLGVSFL